MLREVCEHAPAADVATSQSDQVEQLVRYLEGDKHAGDLAELREGQPENAARGIYHFMRVPDPLDAWRAGMEAEVEALVASVEALSDDEVVDRYRDPWEPEDVPASTIRAKVREEVMGNFRYVAYEESREREYHNGIRDQGRGHVRLDHFASHPIAVAAGLTEAHVIGLRYYSEPPPRIHQSPTGNACLRCNHYGSAHPVSRLWAAPYP